MTETRRDETQASLIMAVAVSAALALGCTSAAPSAAADGEKLVVLAEAAEERPALRTADAVVRLGPRSAALDGRPLFSGPRVALAGSGPRPLVDLVAPPARSAAEALAFTRSLVEAGATVRLVVSRDGERGGIARFSPEALGPPDPAAVHVWLELGEEDLVRTSEGALIPADDARALVMRSSTSGSSARKITPSPSTWAQPSPTDAGQTPWESRPRLGSTHRRSCPLER
ncbi:MAG: hypothetical protein RLP09_13250 [Sandaracinaceae bacterium]